MASTLGHALCGVDCLLIGRLVYPELFYKISFASIVGIALIANVPDLDLLVGPLMGKHHHYFHGQITHSIAFSVICGLFFWLSVKVINNDIYKAQKLALFVFIGLTSHVAVDWFTGPNPGFNPSFGTVVLWPFVEERISSPLTLFLGPHHASLSDLLSMHNIEVMIREVLIFGGLALFLWLVSSNLRVQIADFWQGIFMTRSK